MLRRLGACAVALALLLPAQATASPPSAPDQRAGTTKTRVVKLGHKPVRATTAQKVRLTFEGRRGQLVNLARVDATEQCGGRVLRSGGEAVKPWAQGFWRLPRTATYTAINKACRTREAAPLRLQVRRVVREARLESGSSVAAGSHTRVTHLVPFRVGDRQQATLQGEFDLIRPDRTITRDVFGGDRFGYVVRDYPGPVRYDVPSPHGRYFIDLAPSARVALTVTPLHQATVDGPAVVVSRGSRENASTTFVFAGRAGQWIYAELTSPAGSADEVGWWTSQLRDATGEFPAGVAAVCPWDSQAICRLTRLPATGNYLMDVFNAPGHGTEISMRVRSAARATAATIDGPPVTYTATTPGQWVVGDLPEVPRDSTGGSGATITLSNPSASLRDWRVRAVSGYGPCNPGVGIVDCFGIHEPPNAFTMSPSVLTSPLPWDAFANPAVAVLTVPPGVTGSIDLAVTRPESQP